MWREPYEQNARQVYRASSTWWWNSENTYGCNGVRDDVDFNRNYGILVFRNEYPNLKFFAKTCTGAVYDVLRDVYVEGSYIGRFKFNSCLIGSKIGINKNGGNEPLLTKTLDYSAPGAAPGSIYFAKP
jgi:hypothetical protein